jgi:hypothetical protein
VRDPRPRRSAINIGCCWILFLFVGSLHVSACSYSSMPREVGRNFSVQVLNEGKAIIDLQIELSTNPKGDEESRTVLVLRTDSNGLVAFTALKPGLYFVGVKHPAFSSSEEILVKSHPSKSATKTIAFEWPGVEPLSVQSVSGFLDGPVSTGQPLEDQVHPRYGPLSDARLTLSTAVSGEVIEALVASASGAFDFRPLSAGLYFLQIEPQNSQGIHYSLGFVPIDVDPSAKASTLNLSVFHAICGSLGYKNGEGTDSINAQTH